MHTHTYYSGVDTQPIVVPPCRTPEDGTPEDGTPEDLPAEAEPPRRQKAFLGGYRHKLTAAEYHHAASQTPRRARPGRGVDIVSRDAQVRTPRNGKIHLQVLIAEGLSLVPRIRRQSRWHRRSSARPASPRR